MRTKTNHILAAAIAFAVGATVNTIALAHEGEDHDHKHRDEASAAAGSLTDLWKQINSEHKEIVDFVAAKAYDKMMSRPIICRRC